MKLNQFSIDDGMTWIDLDNPIRFIFREAGEDDDEILDLHVIVTNEGVILDMSGQESGLVPFTAALDLESLVGMTT